MYETQYLIHFTSAWFILLFNITHHREFNVNLTFLGFVVYDDMATDEEAKQDYAYTEQYTNSTHAHGLAVRQHLRANSTYHKRNIISTVFYENCLWTMGKMYIYIFVDSATISILDFYLMGCFIMCLYLNVISLHGFWCGLVRSSDVMYAVREGFTGTHISKSNHLGEMTKPYGKSFPLDIYRYCNYRFHMNVYG